MSTPARSTTSRNVLTGWMRYTPGTLTYLSIWTNSTFRIERHKACAQVAIIEPLDQCVLTFNLCAIRGKICHCFDGKNGCWIKIRV